MSEPSSAPLPPDGDAGPGDVAGTPGGGQTGFGRHPIVIYTVQRLALLLVVGGVLYLFHVRGIFLILFAFLISGAIAMVALRGSREGASYGITHAVKKVNDRIDASSRAEDYDDLDDDLVEPAQSDDEPRA